MSEKIFGKRNKWFYFFYGLELTHEFIFLQPLKVTFIS